MNPSCSRTHPTHSTARPASPTSCQNRAPTRLEVFSVTGQRVAILRQGYQQAGYHRLHWNARDSAGHPLASGMYLYRLVTGEGILTRKLTLLR